MIFEDAKNLFAIYGINLGIEEFEKLSDFENFLIEKNKFMNLTSITESHDVWVKHFLDSIYPMKFDFFNNVSNMLDIGTGAGFPAIPLKIMLPNLDVTMFDALNKRVEFLNEVIEKLNLNKITAYHVRAEVAGKDLKFRENFDITIARAVANLQILSELSLPLTKVGGHFISMKGPDEQVLQSKAGISKLGGTIENIMSYDIENMNRKIISIKKISKTDSKYPRNYNKIKSQPL